MRMLVDGQARELALPAQATLGAALDCLQLQLDALGGPGGRIIVALCVDGQPVEAAQRAELEAQVVAGRTVEITTTLRHDLARVTIGKLAALVEFLGRRQHDIAGTLERGQTQKALSDLADLLTAWQQVQGSFTSLTQLLSLNLSLQMVNGRSASDLLREFRAQLEEIGRALTGQDMVLLGDVLQYEMDTGIAHWNDILATALGIVDGVVERAA